MPSYLNRSIMGKELREETEAEILNVQESNCDLEQVPNLSSADCPALPIYHNA
jgi:hypothetical protein